MAINQEGHVVTDEERNAVRALYDKLGLAPAAELLEVSRETLLRILAGSTVRRGTVALLRQSLVKVKESGDVK